MKTLIEKIVLNYFGKFINGITKENLSVNLLGGNFQLENISLNQQFFDSLNTPFQLTYSSIGKLSLQAAISKLSSTPVECVLDNIYAVFEFKNDQKKEQISVQKLIMEKKEFIQKYIRDTFEDYLKKLRDKDDKKEDGMMTKLGKKIIDNLQLKIINLHLRFQQSRENQRYAWGVTLEQISFITTDAQWKPTFVDRITEAGKNEKLLKKMNLKNLSIYWQSGSKEKNSSFIKQLNSDSQKAKNMANMITDSQYSIISLTSQVKLTINNPENQQAPMYQLSVDLAPIVFQLQKVQVSEMIDFIQKNISENEQILKNLSIKKKKTKKQIQPQEKINLQSTFQQYVQNVLDNYQLTKQKGKINQEQQYQSMVVIKTMTNKIQDQQLLLWTLKPIRQKVKQVREKQLKKKKKGWFGGEYQLTEEQTKALNNFVEQVAESSANERPPECLFFSLRVTIQGGKFAFIHLKNQPEQEKIQFEIGAIDVFLVKSQNDAILDLTVGIQSISLNLQLPIYNSNERLRMNILRNMQAYQQEQFFDPGEENKFVSIRFSKKVQTNEKPIIKTDILGQVKQVAVTYKKIFMKKFKSFFTFQNFNQSMKNQTKKKWQQIKQKNEQKNSQYVQENQVIKMFNIHIKITSPLFVCPLTETGGWCMNLGRLSLQSNRDGEKQVYPIKIQNAFFRYYPDLSLCYKQMTQKQLKQNQIFCLVKDINFLVTFTKFLYEKKQSTNIILPNFEVNFTEKQYKNLISLKDIFKTDESSNNLIQILKKERQQIQKFKIYQGIIRKKSGQLDKWRSYYGILSGQYIHLFGSQKQLKCIQKIPIKNMRIEYNQQSKIIGLFNQQGVTQITGAQFQNNVLEWRDSINNQMKSFRTIYDLVQEMAEKQEKQQMVQTPRKRRESNLDLINKKQKIISFMIQKIVFIYKDQNNKDLMIFNLFNLQFNSVQQNKISNKKITINKIQSIDYIYLYKHKQLQTLIATKQIQIQMIRNKNQDQKKLDIQVSVSDIYINWKPDVLVILLKLVYNYFTKQVKHRVDDGQEKTREQLFQEVLKDPKLSFSMKEYQRNSYGRQVKDKRINFVQKNKRLKQLIRFNMILKKTQVLMIHRQTHLIMFKMIANNIQNELAMGENEKFVSGAIKQLMLYEMSGYPRSSYSQNDKNIPYLIIKPSNLNTSQSLVQYKWSSYESFALPNLQRVNSFLYIVINPIQCHYFQQITFRLIDYILIQIILLLNQPQMVVANENLLEQLKKKQAFSQKQVKQQSQSIVKILFSQYEQVIRRIIDPYFMDMYFQLRHPSILLKPQKTSNFYHRADFKNIIFVNDDRKSAQRFRNCQCPQAMKYIYEQIYEIMCNQCKFYSVKQQNQKYLEEHRIKQQILFDSVDIALSINKLIMQDQINLIYPQMNSYDRSFSTNTKMSKLIIKKLTKQQYLLINKLVNFNMVYDDNKDQCFIHNFKITKLLSPKPIYYDLVIPQIQLTGIEGNLDSNVNLFSMFMDGFKLIYTRKADLNSSFTIRLDKANLVGYEYQIPELSLRRPFNSALMEEPQQPFMSKAPKKLQLMEFKPKGKEEYCTDITIKMKTTGQKIIEMNIQNIEAFLKLHLVQMIFEWCLLEDWVFPTVSIYANDITFHLTIHNMSAWLKQVAQLASNIQPRAFKLLGVFCYKFHRKASYSQQHIQQLMKQKKLSFNDVNRMPQTSYMTILLNTQVFHCLASENTHIKRQVVQKITFNMIEKRYFKVSNQKLCKIKSMANRKLNLDKGLFKFSFTDIFLMQDILIQIGKERQYINKLRQITNPGSNPSLQQISLQSSFQSQLSSLQNFDIDIQSLSLYLINNCRETFIPILRLHINNATINKSNTLKKDLLKAAFQTAAYYFNATIFRWQPMWEKFDIVMSKLVYREEELNVFASIQTKKAVPINISKQMMAALRETLDQWNKKHPNGPQHVQLRKKKQLQHKKKEQKPLGHQSPKKHRSIHETVELVSQYVIRNELGYPIEIYNHIDRKVMYKIENLSQVDYQYQLEKYDDESQISIMIGINIFHPKLKFKKITHICLGRNLNFQIQPEMVQKGKQETQRYLPTKSIINFITQTKDSKRYLILKTSKWIQNYLNNRLEITLLPFDHKQTIFLHDEPHNGKEVSLFRTAGDGQKSRGKDKVRGRQEPNRYRYVGKDGVLKIMGMAMVYNYTPIPLQVNQFFVLPDQFITLSSTFKIQNIYYKDCKGVKVHYDEKNKIYYIYCQGYIIDYAGLYYQLQKAKQFSHQFIKNGLRFHIYLLSDTDSKIKVRLEKKFKSNNNFKCSALIKPTVGNQTFELQNYSNSLCQYQSYGYLSSFSGNQYKDFKKIIQVTPRYVLSNTTGYRIKVCQMQSQQSLILQPGQRIPFFWENKSKPRQIKIAALKDNAMWGYSGPLSIYHSTHSFVVRNNSQIHDYRILSLQIENTSTINFVHIVDCHPKKGNNIMLCNQVEGVTLRIYQSGIFKKDYQILNPHQCVFIVKSKQQIPFGYQIPLQKHQIIMEMIFSINHPKLNGASTYPIILQNIQNNLFEKKIDITTRQNKRVNLLLKLSFEGNVKKLKLTYLQKGLHEIKQGEYICKIPSIIVSLIGYQDKIRKEIINVQLNGIEIESGKTNKTTQYLFTIKQFHIQNCLKTRPIFPVIFQSNVPITTNTKANYFLQFMMLSDNLNSKLIHYIGVSLNKFILSISSEELQCIQENVYQITQALSSQSLGSSLEDMREYELFQKASDDLNSSLYFIQAEIHPLRFNVTFKHVNNWGGRFLKTFASIDNCNLSVSGKQISHFGSKNISQFFNHLKNHYQQGITKVILPMIGNLAILGSPLSLAQRIGSGFKDLIELPSQGFTVSPLQGSKGLAKGAGSLVKNTFQGAFNSVQSVTGSVGNGLSSLAFDQQFSKQRQKIQNDRSEHIGEGLANGAKSIANGFAKGVTGLFTSPVQGAQESGIGGFFVGGLKGITGLVVKPVSGIFDATTKTFQGIKNTPSYLQKKTQKNQRMSRKRNPRVFYTFNRQFRTYDQDLSMCAKIIGEKDQSKYQNLSWYGIYSLVSNSQKKQRKNPLLIVTYQYLIIHNLSQDLLIQSYQSKNIYDAMHQTPTQVKMIIFDQKRKKFGHIIFQLKQPLASKLASQIKAICNCYRPVYGLDFVLVDNRASAAEELRNEKR